MLLCLSPHGGGGDFSSLKAFLLPFSPCGGNFGYVFPGMGSVFFSQFKGFFQFFAPFSPCSGFFTTFASLWGSFFRRLKAFLLLFLLCGGLFTTFFSPYVGLFHYLKALLLRFSPLGDLFHHLKAFLLLFFSMWRPFFLRFSCGESFFSTFWRPFCYFFSPCGSVVFGFMGTLFSLPHPLPKFRRGLMPACPLTPMSSMQYNHSLTASCHFRDILKIVRKHFLIYIFAWLTIFKIRKRNENNIF